MSNGEAKYTRLVDYCVLLCSNTNFLILWIGEVATQFGNWFNFVASYRVVEDLSGRSGVAIALLLVVRYLPRLVWFPFAGAAADTYNRAYVMLVVSLVQAALVATVPVLLSTKSLWLFFVLNFLEFSLSSFYDPARGALVPMVVAKDQLILSSTLDSLAWSLMGAVGASMGGFAVSWLNVTGCFYLDAATFLVAALCAWWIIPSASKSHTPVAVEPSSPMQKSAASTKHPTPSPFSPEILAASYSELNGSALDSCSDSEQQVDQQSSGAVSQRRETMSQRCETTSQRCETMSKQHETMSQQCEVMRQQCTTQVVGSREAAAQGMTHSTSMLQSAPAMHSCGAGIHTAPLQQNATSEAQFPTAQTTAVYAGTLVAGDKCSVATQHQEGSKWEHARNIGAVHEIEPSHSTCKFINKQTSDSSDTRIAIEVLQALGHGQPTSADECNTSTVQGAVQTVLVAGCARRLDGAYGDFTDQDAAALPEELEVFQGERLLPNHGRGDNAVVRGRSKHKRYLHGFHEGFKYIIAPENRDLLLYVCIKACGALSWGGNDVLNAKWSEMKSTQLFHDESVTIGIIYSMVGLGCFLGPLTINAFIPANTTGWLIAVALSFGIRTVGYVAMVIPNIWIVLLSTTFRSAGSNIMWVSSTALLQSLAHNDYQGSVFAMELAVYTVALCASTFLTGLGFDVGHWTASTMSWVMSLVTLPLLVFWALRAHIQARRERDTISHTIRYLALEVNDAVV